MVTCYSSYFDLNTGVELYSNLCFESAFDGGQHKFNNTSIHQSGARRHAG